MTIFSTKTYKHLGYNWFFYVDGQFSTVNSISHSLYLTLTNNLLVASNIYTIVFNTFG